jgi:hypothetical protein
MLEIEDPAEKDRLQKELRSRATPGNIDVNVMTKLDRNNFRGGKMLPPQYADAMSALRGFANSTLHASMVFSAGLNPRLYSYSAEFKDFFPDETGSLSCPEQVSGQARAVGFGVPHRVGIELRRTCFRLQGVPDGTYSGGVQT